MKHFLLTLILASHGLMVHAAGTIQFSNVPTRKMQWYPGEAGQYVPTNAHFVYGVFWGTNRDALTLSLPLGSNSTTTAGSIAVPSGNSYRILGTEADQTVYMQIKAWPEEYGTNWSMGMSGCYQCDETDIRHVTLGPEQGPGTSIWQSVSGNALDRFYPLSLGGPLTPIILFEIQPSISVDEGNQGSVEVILSVNRSAFPVYNYPSNFTSSVWASTSDLTALAGQDYVPTNILLTGHDSQIRIRLIGDTQAEPEEQFIVSLHGASNGKISSYRRNAIVTIREARVVSVRRNVANAVVTIRTTSTQRYALESSPDMVSWSVVPGAENIAGTGGNVQITDSSQPCCDPRFYRMQILP